MLLKIWPAGLLLLWHLLIRFEARKYTTAPLETPFMVSRWWFELLDLLSIKGSEEV